MSDKPDTTLFMLSSLDGKISTGDVDVMDVDSDFRKIKGIREGIQQYYDLEKTTDMHFLITGKVMTKKCASLNVNNRKDEPNKLSANCIIIDGTHLKESGVAYLLKKFNSLTVVTANQNHPAKKVKSENLKIISYKNKINFLDLFKKLKSDYGIKRLTVQSGSMMNATLLRNNLINHISLVVAPCLIGGKDTANLIGGESLHNLKELKYVKALKLRQCNVLKNSYLHLRYDLVLTK
ncbi:MAG: dihydrofolate reductase family protein [Candidatus Gribaldobacteria bacterium]|nr:dihydrofolate reductase family protein [Candidatus Gribaldobacteria bacterium]